MIVAMLVYRLTMCNGYYNWSVCYQYLWQVGKCLGVMEVANIVKLRNTEKKTTLVLEIILSDRLHNILIYSLVPRPHPLEGKGLGKLVPFLVLQA